MRDGKNPYCSLPFNTAFLSQSQHMRLELQGPVGISRLPEQTIQKAIKKGFAFNLLVVGVYSNRARNASNL
jgi:hypothetical protein